MSKTTQTVAVVTCLVLLTVVLAGCTKAQPPAAGPGPMPAAGPPVPQAAAPAGEAGVEPGTLAEAVAVREGLQSYEMTIAIPDEKEITQLVKLENGELVGVKVIVAGDEWMLMDKAEGVIYAYSPELETVMKMAMEGGEDEGTEMPTIDVDSFDADAAIVGSETIDGVDCWVVDTIVKEEGNEAKVWVGKQDGLLRQAEAEDKVIKFTYDKINAVPDSEFELPEGIEILDMAEMMKGMGEETQ